MDAVRNQVRVGSNFSGARALVWGGGDCGRAGGLKSSNSWNNSGVGRANEGLVARFSLLTGLLPYLHGALSYSLVAATAAAAAAAVRSFRAPVCPVFPSSPSLKLRGFVRQSVGPSTRPSAISTFDMQNSLKRPITARV